MLTSVNYLKPFHLANIKAIVVLAPGTDGKLIWTGQETNNAWYARLGYQAESPAKPLQWRVYEPGDCSLCATATATVRWRGPRSEKPGKMPEFKHPTVYRRDNTIIGPREGPSECRVLLCRTCYMTYGTRLAIATYPPMDETSCDECVCKWDGEVLHKCPDHLGVVVQSGIHVNRGEGNLLEPTNPVGPFTREEGELSPHGGTEDFASLLTSELEALIDGSFPFPKTSTPIIPLYSRAPEMVRLADTTSRAKVITEESLKEKAVDMSVQDIVKSMIGARSRISQRTKTEAFTSEYSSKMSDDWYTDCTPFKGHEREVLTWEVLAAPIPMLDKSTAEVKATRSTKDKATMITMFSRVQIKISLDLMNRAIKAMAVDFNQEKDCQQINNVEAKKGNVRPQSGENPKRKEIAVDKDNVRPQSGENPKRKEIAVDTDNVRPQSGENPKRKEIAVATDNVRPQSGENPKKKEIAVATDNVRPQSGENPKRKEIAVDTDNVTPQSGENPKRKEIAVAKDNREEPPAKVARRVDAWRPEAKGWSTFPPLSPNARIQLYDEYGTKFQDNQLLNPTVWQSIAVVRPGRVPRHKPFMNWAGHHLTSVMSESTLLAVTAIKVNPKVLRRGSLFKGHSIREEAQVALYQNESGTWAMISTLGSGGENNSNAEGSAPWCPPSIVAILAAPDHPRQWHLYRGVRQSEGYPRLNSEARPPVGEFPKEGVKGPRKNPRRLERWVPYESRHSNLSPPYTGGTQSWGQAQQVEAEHLLHGHPPALHPFMGTAEGWRKIP
ncbi:hypothetical protein ACEWY4_021816 [Coilia grayii]|uniref:Uncharacterized protein n=1 Tax=Coilia grayii TaxID=363190 RepID=A0ABD1J483_9TELE